MHTIRIFLLTLAITFPSVASSQSRWETATNTGSEKTGDIYLTRCFYRTLGGYEFAVVIRGVCPLTIQVHPESGQVKS